MTDPLHDPSPTPRDRASRPPTPWSHAGGSPRIAIVVVAYNAATTLKWVLDRIPDDFHDRIARVYVCDDASTDETYDVGLEYLADDPPYPLTVIRHPVNLGYGGNQKAGYRRAIADGMDIVVLLHGDGQYAPEVMESITAPIERGDADAVFGSRMIKPGAALRGGMPLYKYVGNKVLTRFENAILGTELSEFHSGYRAYSTSALAAMDVDSNSDGFDFDTEIIIGLVDASMRIAEVPIPTYYGDEICRVNGLRYAFDVCSDVIRWRLHRAGFGSGSTSPPDEVYEWNSHRTSSHETVLRRVLEQSGTHVVDVGCSGGELGARLRPEGRHVTGIDIAAFGDVKENCDEVIECDLDGPDQLPLADNSADVVVLADILEHLRDPLDRLRDAVRIVRPDGVVIVSIPNVGHLYPRVRIATGMFDYDSRGILDRTHLRFFTRRSMTRLMTDAGLDVLEMDATGFVGDGSAIPTRALRWIESVGRRVRPTLFAYQFVAVCRPRATANNDNPTA